MGKFGDQIMLLEGLNDPGPGGGLGRGGVEIISRRGSLSGMGLGYTVFGVKVGVDEPKTASDCFGPALIAYPDKCKQLAINAVEKKVEEVIGVKPEKPAAKPVELLTLQEYISKGYATTYSNGRTYLDISKVPANTRLKPWAKYGEVWASREQFDDPKPPEDVVVAWAPIALEAIPAYFSTGYSPLIKAQGKGFLFSSKIGRGIGTPDPGKGDSFQQPRGGTQYIYLAEFQSYLAVESFLATYYLENKPTPKPVVPYFKPGLIPGLVDLFNKAKAAQEARQKDGGGGGGKEDGGGGGFKEAGIPLWGWGLIGLGVLGLGGAVWYFSKPKVPSATAGLGYYRPRKHR